MKLLGAALVLLVWAAPATGQQTEQPVDYWAYVANESSDMVSLVRFGPGGLVEEKTVAVGLRPADLEGAHGITVAPTGDFWYVSLAHGTPFGKIWKFETGTNRFVDSVTVGLFPATMAVTPDGSTLAVVNFNLHGRHSPSSVSLVFTPFMDEMAQIETCVMPHGGTLSRDGTKHYSTCMMSDQLVEIDMVGQRVARRLRLSQGKVGLLDISDTGPYHGDGQCKPTWVAIAPDGVTGYVPCNGRGTVLEISLADMSVTREFSTGRGPYNASVSPDGSTLAVSLKGDQAVAIIDLATGNQSAVATSQPVSHGVVITPDSRYAMVTNESVGATPGTIDVIDLHRRALISSASLQLQPGGIGFWKMEAAKTATR